MSLIFKAKFSKFDTNPILDYVLKMFLTHRRYKSYNFFNNNYPLPPKVLLVILVRKFLILNKYIIFIGSDLSLGN